MCIRDSYRPQGSDSFKLAAVVHLGTHKIQLFPVLHRATDFLAHLKNRPDGMSVHSILHQFPNVCETGYYETGICEPKAPIQLNIVCKIKLSSSSPAALPLPTIDNKSKPIKQLL